MTASRLAIVIVGVLLPYAARLPGGAAWVRQYTEAGIGGFVFIQAFNALAWGSLLALSFRIRRPAWLLLPCLAGFGFLAWAHCRLDLAADAQAAIAVVFFPVYALVPIAVGGLAAYALDRRSAGARGG